MITVFAIILVLISTVAFLYFGRAFYQLYQVDLLNKNFWKEYGLNSILLTIIWILLFVGGIGLLLGEPWGNNLVKITFGLFWIGAMFSWLQHLIGGIQLLYTKKDIKFSTLLEEAPHTKEVMEKTFDLFQNFSEEEESNTDSLNAFFDESDDEFSSSLTAETKKMIIGKTFGFLLVSVVLYLGWMIL